MMRFEEWVYERMKNKFEANKVIKCYSPKYMPINISKLREVLDRITKKMPTT